MIESKGHKITPIDGDLAVSRNAEIGGDADIHGKARVAGSLKVEGFLDAPNIKGAVKGLFATEEELKREYPNPRPGWCAIVLADDERGFLYLAKNREWEKQSEEAQPFKFIADSINVFASKGELANETQRAQGAENILTQRIVNETVRATEAENEIKKDAVKFNRIGITGYADKLELRAATIDGDEVRYIDIPAATETKAGVVSAEDKKKFVKSITWNNDSDMNSFTTAGVYDIKGERKRDNDNLPILNTGGGHTFNARLTVLDSSISGSGENDDKCITQVLSFSNRLGQGEVYIRTGKGSSLDNLTWENWSTLQRNVDVGSLESKVDLKKYIDNGIYSGVFRYGSNYNNLRAFVMVVINDYAIGLSPRRVSQFLYSIDKATGKVSYEVQTCEGETWKGWEILNKGEIDSMINSAIADLVGTAPETLDTLQEIADWVSKHQDLYGTLKTLAEENTKKINEEITRATEAETEIKSKAVDADSLYVAQEIDNVRINFDTLDDGKYSGEIIIPAATTESAGVMSAEDKRNLLSIIGESLAEFDFTDGKVANYQSRRFAYPFKAGNKYLLKVLTDDNVATTYFSFRVEDGTALQDNLLTGNGPREGAFVCNEDCDYLYMTIQSNGVAIVYDVEVVNLSKNSIGALAYDIAEKDVRLTSIERVIMQLPTLEDFADGCDLDKNGVFKSLSGYSATEKYFYIPANTKVVGKARNYSGRRIIAIYDIEYNFLEKIVGVDLNTDVDFDIEYDYPIYIRAASSTSLLKYFSISYVGDNIPQDVNLLNKRITSVEGSTKSLGKPSCLNYDDFEIGGMTLDATGWTYTTNSVSRVRMKAGITYHLFVGDTIVLPDDVRAYLGYRINGVYKIKSWFTGEWTVTEDGDYKILLSGVTENTLSSKYDLLTDVRISGGERRYENTLPIDADALSTLRVINHRGFNTEAPENTLPAFKLSKLKGFRYVEVDVQHTADGVPVCIHDWTVERTSNGGDRRVDSMTFEEIRALDFGSWFSTDYAGTQIPTFEEFLILCKQLGLKPYVELKDGTTEQIRHLFDLVRLYGMEKHTTFISFHLQLLQNILSCSKNARVGYVDDAYSADYLNALIGLKDIGGDVFADLQSSAVTDDVLMELRQNGFEVELWTTALTNTRAFKADGVTTDAALYWEYSGDRPVWYSVANGWKE